MSDLNIFYAALADIPDAEPITCERCAHCGRIDKILRSHCDGFPELSWFIVPIDYAAKCDRFKEK